MHSHMWRMQQGDVIALRLLKLKEDRMILPNQKEHVMKIRFTTLPLASLVLAGALAASTTGASALGLKDCSDKYGVAKEAGKLAGKTWNEFRKSECGTDAKPVVETKPADAKAAAPAKAEAAKPAAPKVEAKPEVKPEAKKADAKPATAAPSTTTVGSTVFPKGLDAKYASEKASKQRFHTCLDQYKINKAGNGNGGMKWIQKGGGYYSECNKRLKA